MKIKNLKIGTQYIGLHVARSAQHEVQVARNPWRQPHFFYVFIKVF